jgi:GNAT superfamily N-acetyltransferase
MSSVSIRRAGRQDAEVFLALVRALADYEHLAPPDEEACARLLEDGFGARPRFDPYLAELNGEVVAYAIVLENYSSFLARPTLYLEDLFVVPSARRNRVGTAMLGFLAREAITRGCARMEWVVLGWNELAQSLYRKIGAEMLDEWRICRLTGDPLLALADAGQQDR